MTVPTWLSLLALICAPTLAGLLVVRALAKTRKGRPLFVVVLAVLGSIALLGNAGWTTFQIHQCEAHDLCDRAPAWVGEGLHELQRMDGGCVYLSQGCGAGGAP